MSSDFLDSNSVLERAQKEGLYGKLIVQLRKDFGRANVDIELGQDTSPIQLKTILHEKLYYLILEKFSEYLNLLYVIDVPERAFKDLEVTDVVEVSRQVTLLVLKRELQKLWLKAKYG